MLGFSSICYDPPAAPFLPRRTNCFFLYDAESWQICTPSWPLRTGRRLPASLSIRQPNQAFSSRAQAYLQASSCLHFTATRSRHARLLFSLFDPVSPFRLLLPISREASCGLAISFCDLVPGWFLNMCPPLGAPKPRPLAISNPILACCFTCKALPLFRYESRSGWILVEWLPFTTISQQ